MYARDRLRPGYCLCYVYVYVICCGMWECGRVAAPDSLKSERICRVTYQLVRPHLYDLPRPQHDQHVSHARQMRQNRCIQPLLAARALKSALVVAHAIRMPQRGRSNDASRGPRVSALRLPRGSQADGIQERRCTSLSHHETRITKEHSECHAQVARIR